VDQASALKSLIKLSIIDSEIAISVIFENFFFNRFNANSSGSINGSFPDAISISAKVSRQASMSGDLYGEWREHE